jgi:hypothetical protein
MGIVKANRINVDAVQESRASGGIEFTRAGSRNRNSLAE